MLWIVNRMDSRKVCKALGLPVVPTGCRARYEHMYGEIRLCPTMLQEIKCTLVVQLWSFSAPDVWLVLGHIDGYLLTLAFFHGAATDPRKTSYRIANVRTIDEVVKYFDPDVALCTMLAAMLS